jgi:DNA-binding MurR/RpiR family transcriptional regulator
MVSFPPFEEQMRDKLVSVRRANGDGAHESLELRFANAQSRLNDRRRRLVRAILDSPEETYYLSSRELARRYDVDAATVVRTIQALGYKRFADFAADLRRHFVTRITPYAVMKASRREKRSLAAHIRHSVEMERENLHALEAGLDTDKITQLAREIHRARSIFVVGVDLAASLSSFLAYGLTPLGFHADAPVGTEGNLHHRIRVLTEKDLLIAISFGRCLRETVESVLRAKERGVPTFGITDGDTTPIAIHCDNFLIAPVSSPSITGSYVAPMGLLNAVLVACAHIQPKRSLALLRQTEEEYSSGSRWYAEPGGRSRPTANDNRKPRNAGHRTSGKQRPTRRRRR